MKIFYVLLCLLQLSIFSFSQELQFDHLTEEDGLTYATVTSILQDDKGFMWFASFKGISRYDGYEMKTYYYEKGTNRGPNDNRIASLLQDKKGDIWMGLLNNGLSIFHPETDTFEHFFGGEGDEFMVSSSSVTKIFQDSQNDIWIGSNYGLSIVSEDRSNVRKYYPEEGNKNTVNGKVISDIVEDKWNRVWLATTNRKLCVYNKNNATFSEVEYTNEALANFEDNEHKKLLIYNDTLLFIGSDNGGISEYNLLTGKFNTYLKSGNSKGPSSNSIKDFIQVGNEIWIGTDGAGLDVFNVETKQFRNYTNSLLNQTSISSDVIWTLYKDKQDNIWVGTYLNGVDKYDANKNAFRQISSNPYKANSIPNKPVLAIFEDNKKRTWVGSDWGGLHLRENSEKEYVHYSRKGKVVPNFDNDVVKCISQDRTGNLLVGTYLKGLRIYDFENDKYYNIRKTENNSLIPNNNIWSMLTDSKGVTWLGLLGGGIAIYDPDTKTCKAVSIDIKNRGQFYVYHLYEDRNSNIWASTDGGILMYDRSADKWQTDLFSDLITQDHNFNYVKSVCEDNYKHIWIATGAGLVKYQPESKEFFVFNLENDIPELPILNLIKDNQGDLVITSKKYISKFDVETNSVMSFHTDGNSYNHNTIYKNQKGEIEVGGIKGITVFNPNDLKKNIQPPAIYITGLEIFNKLQLPTDSTSVLRKEVWASDAIELDYDQSVINFNFSAINYTETDRNKYAYMLEGFDTDWVYEDKRRSATYTNLDPGKYKFHVKASNNHGVWNNEGASVTIVVSSPFWETVWFRLLLFTVFIIALYFLQKVRISLLKRRYALEAIKSEREKMKIRNENLVKELDSTKDELASITMNHLHKNQSLQQVKQKLEEVSQGVGSNEQRKIRGIIKDLNKESDDHDYWDKFEHQFNKSHNNFIEKLKETYPDLSKRELRLCAYLKMDLGNQEIATLMNVSLRTLETSRYRIRKKVGLENRKSLTKMITRF
ncbi:two-component regulator propeller domain-containing protein [Flammeovirga kamogawensis]|uniref:PLD phosphodiesterase domain-containing protein n=1 Tax=Flammeovirga kamogawensis TaxID=373891 RepID=A0ABX8GUT2_9BACT|nr:two-component regulator propeller domain-containing protein [Flammeovirga kamogawensis]MBB6459651.1 ligand-binding sensor domain-containing protein/DNA-binding CsgD family transcriptional regulator [Flammeovirga kamogawensis]QWG07286.1 hypothetical protein KM029_18580 [Flammeovirga kamogawensis]TRX69104.1 hypothetical protein EO216_13580 [Flammeovirga kamogawensis]